VATITDPAVTKSGDPATAAVGDTVVFTIVVENLGNTNATNVQVLDTVPAFLTVTSVTSSPPADTNNSAGNVVDLIYNTVTPSDVYTITVTTVVNSSPTPPSQTNTVTLTADADDDTSNNTDLAPITIVEPRIQAPETGFAPGRVSSIPAQTAETTYDQYGYVSIRIPKLGVNTEVVGVPQTEDSWDVTWLWDQVGYLNGTAFPGWDGNSVLTSHVYLPNGLPGPFVDLKSLSWGDRILVDSFGTRYVYEVRESRLKYPDDPDILQHEELPWLTLVTCQGYQESTDTYRWRRVVRAVLISSYTPRIGR
jgi:LPXTG-site transpeptidase (sortase) family protein